MYNMIPNTSITTGGVPAPASITTTALPAPVPRRALRVPPVNLRNILIMPAGERAALLNSLIMKICIGSRVEVSAPTHLLLTVSIAAQAAYRQGYQYIKVPSKIVSYSAVMYLINWLNDSAKRVFAFPIAPCATMVRNIEVYRAARELGMGWYVEHIRQRIDAYIQSSVPRFDEVNLIVASSKAVGDSLFRVLVIRLADLRSKGNLGELKALQGYEGTVEGGRKILLKAMGIVDWVSETVHGGWEEMEKAQWEREVWGEEEGGVKVPEEEMVE